MSPLDISTTKALEEVVVVGYGTAKKESLTSAITNIVASEIKTTTHASLAQSLSGKISGLRFVKTQVSLETLMN